MRDSLEKINHRENQSHFYLIIRLFQIVFQKKKLSISISDSSKRYSINSPQSSKQGNLSEPISFTLKNNSEIKKN